MAERRPATARAPGPAARDPAQPVLPRPSCNPGGLRASGSERFARFMGTASFLIYMTVFVARCGSAGTSSAPQDQRFDAYPFIFLTLMLSLQASYAAPLILLAQNRQADRDRVALEQDRARDERNLADTEYLTREVAALRHRPARRRRPATSCAPSCAACSRRSRSAAAATAHDAAAATSAGRRRVGDAPGPVRSAGPGRARPSMGACPTPCTVTDDALLTALSTVNDPEIRKPITELGMVESGQRRRGDGRVAVTILLTVSGCPHEGDADHATRRRPC